MLTQELQFLVILRKWQSKRPSKMISSRSKCHLSWCSNIISSNLLSERKQLLGNPRLRNCPASISCSQTHSNKMLAGKGRLEMRLMGITRRGNTNRSVMRCRPCWRSSIRSMTLPSPKIRRRESRWWVMRWPFLRKLPVSLTSVRSTIITRCSWWLSNSRSNSSRTSVRQHRQFWWLNHRYRQISDLRRSCRTWWSWPHRSSQVKFPCFIVQNRVNQLQIGCLSSVEAVYQTSHLTWINKAL